MRSKCSTSDRLKVFFQNSQYQIASRFAKISTVIPRWNDGYQAAVKAGELDAYISAEFLVYPQYLKKAFSTGDGIWLDLYIGEKKKQGHPPNGDFKKAHTQLNEIIEEEFAYLKSAAEKAGVGEELTRLSTTLDQVGTAICFRPRQNIRILWIADCLYLDIQSFLAAGLASAELDLQPDLVTTKNPVERYEKISSLVQSNTYDAIFYCPFSYENSASYTRLLNYRHPVSNAFSARQLAHDEGNSVTSILDLIIENTSCPVFIHNASGVRRHHGGIKEAVKDALTLYARIEYSKTINSYLSDQIHQHNTKPGNSPIIVIDEFSIVKATGMRNSGAYFHHFGLQHPGRLGALLKDTYLDALLTVKNLHKRKVVICDLDNTLWKGVIGEGAVEQYKDRQAILKSLKDKGILLAINSKNNPENVTWNGAVLKSDDFACTRINWQTKAENISEIAGEMNLNTNSFIFVDDRADERAMVALVHPEITTLDADESSTWRRLALWSEMLDNPGGIDRTQMYQERKKRKSFVNSKPEHSTASLFSQLDLKCTIRPSENKNLPRISELINRTNQFNTTGRRTSLKEIKSWHEHPDWSIYTARTSDRFGDMGLVGVLVTRQEGKKTIIEIFVLSCRVFGYGIETAILKAVSEANKNRIISGTIVPTSVNQPCQSVYQDHHFKKEGDHWIYDHSSPPVINKDWLSVDG